MLDSNLGLPRVIESKRASRWEVWQHFIVSHRQPSTAQHSTAQPSTAAGPVTAMNPVHAPPPVRQRSSSVVSVPSSCPNKIIFSLVGLPARGKSFLSSKIVSFFQWSGTSARIFNVGSKRRDMEGAKKSGHSTFFSNSNGAAVSKRDEIALAALDEAINWLLNENGSIALFDATNTTKARRKMIQNRINEENVSINLIFIESICTDEDVLRNNLLQKIRHSPDFDGIAEEVALKDLRDRITAYEQVYEPVADEENVAYIKVIDFHSKVICYQIFGAIPLRCVQLLMSSHVGSRPVYLIRSGHCNDVDDMNRDLLVAAQGKAIPLQCRGISGVSGPPGYKSAEVSTTTTTTGASTATTNMTHVEMSSAPTSAMSSLSTVASPTLPPSVLKIPSARTCNSHLSEKGHRFGRRLHRFLCDQDKYAHGGVPAVPFTSNTPRAVETAAYLPHPPELYQQWSALNILDTGICHGLSVKTIREEMQSEFEQWKKNPFLYRFPGGESTLDMNKRLGDVVLEIERLQEPAVVVSHLSTIQSLVAYFTSLDTHQIPFVSVPQHSVIMLTPNIYGWTLKLITEDELPDVP